jgi:hypothetical protein
VPSARLRFAGETAFLILVAVGLVLAEFDPLVIGVVMFTVWVLVALLERASSKAARAAEGREPPSEPLPQVERVDVAPVAVPVAAEAPPEVEPEPPPKPTVSERSARAILASAPPPLPPEPTKPRPKPKSVRRRFVQRTPRRPAPSPPEPEAEPEPVTVSAGLPREWNLWELQRAVRDAADDPRHDEWIALLIHLREFANADGDLPIEFDGLVRESFGSILEPEPEPAAAS